MTAQPLGSALDAYLTLRDASGRELVSDDDYVTRDPVLAYRFRSAGEYAIESPDQYVTPNGMVRMRVSTTQQNQTCFQYGLEMEAAVSE